jgi:predicted amidophosphoribosyltransferase
VTILGEYRDPILRTLITQFKYKSARCLSASFSSLLKRFREEWQGTWPWAGLDQGLVVPAPSDPKHVRQRGFDHTGLLAGHVRDALIPWAEIEQPLLRQPRQWKNADLKTPEMRTANVSGSIKTLKPLAGPVFLVDDVVTSGATSSETARALQAAGASDIHLITLAAG